MLNYFNIKTSSLSLCVIIASFLGVSISYSDFYLFHLVLFLSALVWLYQLKQNKFKMDLSFLSKNHINSIIIIFLWYLISLLWAPSLTYGLKYIFYIFCGLLISINVIYFSNNIRKIDKIFKILSIFVYAEILIALLESFHKFQDANFIIFTRRWQLFWQRSYKLFKI